jgi:hypothetical protein
LAAISETVRWWIQNAEATTMITVNMTVGSWSLIFCHMTVMGLKRLTGY